MGHWAKAFKNGQGEDLVEEVKKPRKKRNNSSSEKAYQLSTDNLLSLYLHPSSLAFNPYFLYRRMEDPNKQNFIFSPFLEYDYGVEWVVEADEATKEFKEKYQKILIQLKSSPHYFHLKDFFREEVEEVLKSRLWDPANPFLLFSSLKSILSELEDLKLPIVPGLSYKQVQIAILKLILWKGFVFGEKEGKRWDEIRKEIEREVGEGKWVEGENGQENKDLLKNIAQFNQSALSSPFSSYKSSWLNYVSASFPQEIEINTQVKERNGIQNGDWSFEKIKDKLKNGKLKGKCSSPSCSLLGEQVNGQKLSKRNTENHQTQSLLKELFQSWSQKKYPPSSPSLLLLSSTKWGEEKRLGKGNGSGKNLEDQIINGSDENNKSGTIFTEPDPWPQVLSSFLLKLSSSLNNYSELIAKSKDKLLKDFLDNSRVFEVQSFFKLEEREVLGKNLPLNLKITNNWLKKNL